MLCHPKSSMRQPALFAAESALLRYDESFMSTLKTAADQQICLHQESYSRPTNLCPPGLTACPTACHESVLAGLHSRNNPSQQSCEQQSPLVRCSVSVLHCKVATSWHSPQQILIPDIVRPLCPVSCKLLTSRMCFYPPLSLWCRPVSGRLCGCDVVRLLC